MCEVRAERKWRAGPLTPRMLELLARMAATDSPAIWDYSRGVRRDTTTLDGQPIAGVTLNGLSIRDFVKHEPGSAPRTMAYRLTDAGRQALI